MAGNVEKEPAVAPGVNELRSARAAEWNSAENEGTGIVSELLPAILAFLTNEGDGLKLTKSEPCDSERWERGFES